MIVYAFSYEDEAAAVAEYDRFVEWSREHMPEDVSVWRTSIDGKQHIVVADDSDERRSGAEVGWMSYAEFGWTGTAYILSAEDARAFGERRRGAIVAGFLAGKRGRIEQRATFPPGQQPEVHGGRWTGPGDDGRRN